MSRSSRKVSARLYRNVVVAYDGSEVAKAAPLRSSILHDARCDVLVVQPPPA